MVKQVSNRQFEKELQEKQSEFDDRNYCLNVSINQLINDFIIEKNAKNKAYYFILQNGYIEQFKEYCASHS